MIDIGFKNPSRDFPSSIFINWSASYLHIIISSRIISKNIVREPVLSYNL